MDYIVFHSDRRFYPETANPNAAMTSKQLVEALSSLPDDLPVFFGYGGNVYAFHNAPHIQRRKE